MDLGKRVEALEAAVIWLAETMRYGSAKREKPPIIDAVFKENSRPDEPERRKDNEVAVPDAESYINLSANH